MTPLQMVRVKSRKLLQVLGELTSQVRLVASSIDFLLKVLKCSDTFGGAHPVPYSNKAIINIS